MRSFAVFAFLLSSISASAEIVNVQCSLSRDARYTAEVTVPQTFHKETPSKDDRKYGVLANLVADQPYVLVIDGISYSNKPNDNFSLALWNKELSPTMADYDKQGFALFNGRSYSFKLYSDAGYPINVVQVPVKDGHFVASGTFSYPGFDGIQNPTICTFAPRQ